ncbi:lactonase family protein [Gordonia sp. (in: high G+C Gram-positive bacteria)]|uniref:lactonase family protein n=1 Tax=Gordonia sp. (in: high G+C Gram-positive bacteria) TaxID=84139 RepID=UPI0039E3F676
MSKPVDRMYVVAQGGGIAALNLYGDGSVDHLVADPYPTGAGTFCVRTTPDGKYLYTAQGMGLGLPYSIRQARKPALLTYSIADDGTLTKIDEFALDRTPVAMAVSADGRNLYLGVGNGPAGFFRGAIAHHRIRDDGTPAPVGEPIRMGRFLDGAPQPYLTPDGKRLYVASVFAKSVVWFDVADDGALSGPVGRVKSSGLFPITPVFSTSGDYLYVANEQSKSITAFHVAGDGGLVELPDSPYATGKFPHNPVATADGRFVYFANTMSHSIDGFAIGADGSLTRVPGAPVATEPGPAMLAVSSDGTWLYLISSPVFKEGSKVVVTSFRIDDDGSLQPSGHEPVPTGLVFADGPSAAVLPV